MGLKSDLLVICFRALYQFCGYYF